LRITVQFIKTRDLLNHDWIFTHESVWLLHVCKLNYIWLYLNLFSNDFAWLNPIVINRSWFIIGFHLMQLMNSLPLNSWRRSIPTFFLAERILRTIHTTDACMVKVMIKFPVSSFGGDIRKFWRGVLLCDLVSIWKGVPIRAIVCIW
jgi:hypothetical protein